jgi:hypothetical protein
LAPGLGITTSLTPWSWTCGIVGHPFGVDLTKLAQHQAIADDLLDLLVTSAIEVLDKQHVQDDLDCDRICLKTKVGG